LSINKLQTKSASSSYTMDNYR